MLSNKENPINSSYSKSQLKNCVPWDMCQSHCISLSQQCNCPSKASVHKTITYQVLVIRSTIQHEFEKQLFYLTLKFIELLQEKISFLYESRLEYTTNYFFFSLYRQKFNYTKIKAVYDFFIEHLGLSFHQFSNWNKAFSAVYLHVGERNISAFDRQTAKVIKRQISWKSYNLWHLSINKYL